MTEINFDKFLPAEKKPGNHYLLPENNIKGIICGRTGVGKTNLICNMIFNKKFSQPGFDHLYLFSKTINQPKYKLLQDAFQCIKEHTGERSGFFFYNKENLIEPDQLDKKKRNLVIFDDIMLDDKAQNIIGKYYSFGRHNNAQCFYLAQSFHKIPKQVIRDNSNFLILYDMPKKDLISIHQNYVGGDMEFKEFKNFFDDVLKESKYVIIDITSLPQKGKYRAGFDIAYIPNKFSQINNNY